MGRAPEGLRDQALGDEAVPRLVPRKCDCLEEGAGPDQKEFDRHREAHDADPRAGPLRCERARDGSDDSRKDDITEARVEHEVRRREEALPAHDDVAPDVPIEAEGLEEQPRQRKAENGPSGDAGQGTKKARDVHRLARTARRPSPGRYFKPRGSRGSRLRSDPVDRHEELGL